MSFSTTIEERKQFKFSLITIVRMNDGKVVEKWRENHQLGLVRQLGMELKPKEGQNPKAKAERP
jgi:hypothetical protein